MFPEEYERNANDTESSNIMSINLLEFVCITTSLDQPCLSKGYSFCLKPIQSEMTPTYQEILSYWQLFWAILFSLQTAL